MLQVVPSEGNCPLSPNTLIQWSDIISTQVHYVLQTPIMLIKGYDYGESNVWWKILLESKSFLSQNTDIGICHDNNILELGVMYDVLKRKF